MQESLIFNTNDHSYLYQGKRVPSVTEIIRFLNVDVIGTASREARDAAAERGTRIHEACTVYDFDPDAEIDGDIVGYVQAYADFRRDYGIRDWLLYEAMFGNYEFAGTLDRYGMVDGKPTVLDIKTGSKLHMEAHAVQLAGYAYLLRQNNYLPLQGAVLHLKKDGKYTLKFTDVDIHGIPSKMFGKCLTLHNYLKGEI